MEKELNKREQLLKEKEQAQQELQALKEKKAQEEKAANTFFKAFLISDAIVSTAVVTALSPFIHYGNENPFSLKEMIQEYATETVDNYGNPVITTLDTQEHELNKETKINLEFFDQWVKEEDYYKRTVTKYEIDGDQILKDYYKNNINTITIEDVNKYKNVYSYTEEYSKVSEDEINKEPYVRMSATYKNKLVASKETLFNNIQDIAICFCGTVLLWFANIFVTYCGLDQASKSRKKKRQEPNIDTLISEKETIIKDIEIKLSNLNDDEFLDKMTEALNEFADYHNSKRKSLVTHEVIEKK